MPILNEDSNRNLGRRDFLLLGGAAALSLTGCAQIPSRARALEVAPTQASPAFGSTSAYAALPGERFPIPAVDLSQLEPRFRWQMMDYPTTVAPGTVVVDTSSFYLYHVQAGGQAMRYGVGLGREGFAWSGRAKIQWKRA